MTGMPDFTMALDPALGVEKARVVFFSSDWQCRLCDKQVETEETEPNDEGEIMAYCLTNLDGDFHGVVHCICLSVSYWAVIDKETSARKKL